jgi:hypothetical protein
LGVEVVDLTLCTVHYEFIQEFNVPAREAFAWCTDYRPDDMALMRDDNATRKVHRVSDDDVILVDTFLDDSGKSVEKQKLVCLYPARLMWTSTHLTGPNKHSQFLYEITPVTRRKSQLKFTAASLDYLIESKRGAEDRGKELRKMDAENWKLLAQEMNKELNQSM